MKSIWDNNIAAACRDDLDLRVYTSQLLGAEEDLVLHGGGNTSVKISEKNIFGEEEDILYVKGSGWDLATIERPGFAPVKMNVLLKLAELPELSDSDMVKNQRMAMTDPSAPNPSVEAILHAIIPFKFVDHTHADTVVAMTNTPEGENHVRDVYGDRILIVPYVMPGFVLARKIYEMTRNLDWSSIDGMVLRHHGIFTFADDARTSYEKMIELVTMAEDFFSNSTPSKHILTDNTEVDIKNIAKIRRAVSRAAGKPMLAMLDTSEKPADFSKRQNINALVSRGPLTPDHIIRTKRTACIFESDIDAAVDKFTDDYRKYFKRYAANETMLDPAPRWGIMKGHGIMAFGPTRKHLRIINDISNHTIKAISLAEEMGGWTALPEEDLFQMEYWELEQAKLKKAGQPKAMEGKVALITGAASGIGKACAHLLSGMGAAVVTLDISPETEVIFSSSNVLGISCDVTDDHAVQKAIARSIHQFGGIDMFISNAGMFPPSVKIEDMDEETWSRSLELNLSSHRRLLTHLIPFLKLGFEPSVVFVGSKNVPAPGPGASAYSVAKAGLAQLARVAALELGSSGIRINSVHPNAVYDTAIWTDEVLQARADHYGLTVEEYKTNNVLKTEVTSHDVALTVAALLGNSFGKTTGAAVPVDGGNERVI